MIVIGVIGKNGSGKDEKESPLILTETFSASF